jgi:hypothetical protein
MRALGEPDQLVLGRCYRMTSRATLAWWAGATRQGVWWSRLQATAVGVYSAAFRAACGDGERPVLDTVSLAGLLPRAEDRRVRLLVRSDEAHEKLATILRRDISGSIRIFGSATRCVNLVARQAGWISDTATAMVSRDLRTIPVTSLPDGFEVRPVRRLQDDALRAVALEDAVAAARSAAPSLVEADLTFAEYLRSLPSAYRLYAAVDPEGVIRATSGAGVFGRYASVIFVNTAAAWQGRGIGQAMTACALDAGPAAGRYASLFGRVARGPVDLPPPGLRGRQPAGAFPADRTNCRRRLAVTWSRRCSRERESPGAPAG